MARPAGANTDDDCVRGIGPTSPHGSRACNTIRTQKNALLIFLERVQMLDTNGWSFQLITMPLWLLSWRVVGNVKIETKSKFCHCVNDETLFDNFLYLIRHGSNSYCTDFQFLACQSFVYVQGHL